jgi:two-component system, NarL family, response regulator LiaR
MPTVRVLIADDAAVIRKAIKSFLECESTVQVCGEATNYSQTLELAASLKPDFILLDIYMPDRTNFEPAFVKSKLLSTSQVLAMSLLSNENEPHVLAAQYGAAAVLDKAQLFEELIAAIERIRS